MLKRLHTHYHLPITQAFCRGSGNFAGMYTREQASQLRQAFWTAFGQYMTPVPDAAGNRINWINYKTGIRHLYFKMDAGKQQAIISINITHNDNQLRHLYFEQLKQVSAILQAELPEPWHWEADARDENGKQYSTVYTCMEGVSIFKQSDWPAIIAFFKERIIALDRFWQEVRFFFEELK